MYADLCSNCWRNDSTVRYGRRKLEWFNRAVPSWFIDPRWPFNQSGSTCTFVGPFVNYKKKKNDWEPASAHQRWFPSDTSINPNGRIYLYNLTVIMSSFVFLYSQDSASINYQHLIAAGRGDHTVAKVSSFSLLTMFGFFFSSLFENDHDSIVMDGHRRKNPAIEATPT